MLQAMILTAARLADKRFLEIVKACCTQNLNESLNHLIWSLAPKEQFVSSQQTSLSVSLAVCLFNDGFMYTMEEMHKLCDLSYKESGLQIWKKLDIERTQYVDYQITWQYHERRKQWKRIRCKQHHAVQHPERSAIPLWSFLHLLSPQLAEGSEPPYF